MSTLPEPDPADLQAMFRSAFKRADRMERTGRALLAAADEMRETTRRMEAVTGIPLLPVPASPGHRHLSAVPSLPA